MFTVLAQAAHEFVGDETEARSRLYQGRALALEGDGDWQNALGDYKRAQELAKQAGCALIDADAWPGDVQSPERCVKTIAACISVVCWLIKAWVMCAPGQECVCARTKPSCRLELDPYTTHSIGNCYAALGEWQKARNSFNLAARLFDAQPKDASLEQKAAANLDGSIYARPNAALALAQLGDVGGARPLLTLLQPDCCFTECMSMICCSAASAAL